LFDASKYNVGANELSTSQGLGNVIVSAEVSKPDWLGYVQVTFSHYILLPESALQWSSAGEEGLKAISVTYDPSLETMNRYEAIN